jgi:hypothetical protein
MVPREELTRNFFSILSLALWKSLICDAVSLALLVLDKIRMEI